MILLVIIYLAFISLGLPDSILGSAWPVISSEWGLPLDAAGYISFVLIGSTIFSSFMSGRMIKKYGTAKLTIFSCGLTGLSLLGYAFAPSYTWLLGLSIPLGLGAGSVDAALNNYVATHYKAHHMNWLHAFWGVGASLGPMIMSVYLLTSWHIGYRVVALIQLSLFVLFVVSYKLWPKENFETQEHPEKNVFKIKGASYAYLSFLLYCMAEFSVGLWSASYLVNIKALSPEIAARYVAIYYGGITIGRILSGCLAFKLKNKQLIIYGLSLSIVAISMLIFVESSLLLLIALTCFGMGLAPFYPSMIHETPKHFGQENAQTIIGHQVGFAATGSAILPPVIGAVLKRTSLVYFPWIILISLFLVGICVVNLYRLKRN